MGGTLALGHRGHVRHRRGRGPQSRTQVAGGDDGRVVVRTQDPEQHEHRKQEDQAHLQGEVGQGPARRRLPDKLDGPVNSYGLLDFFFYRLIVF